MHNALRTDVAETAGGHLAVHGVALGVELLEEILLAVVGHHHPIGYHQSGVQWGRGVQSLRMP